MRPLVHRVETRDAVRGLELLGRHLRIFDKGRTPLSTGPVFVLPEGSEVAIT